MYILLFLSWIGLQSTCHYRGLVCMYILLSLSWVSLYVLFLSWLSLYVLMSLSWVSLYVHMSLSWVSLYIHLSHFDFHSIISQSQNKVFWCLIKFWPFEIQVELFLCCFARHTVFLICFIPNMFLWVYIGLTEPSALKHLFAFRLLFLECCFPC